MRSRHCETGAKDQKVTDFFISLEIGKAVFCVWNDMSGLVPQTVEPGNLPDVRLEGKNQPGTLKNHFSSEEKSK